MDRQQRTVERVLHKRYPEWGVGVVVGERFPGLLVRFEISHPREGGGWSDEWISAAGHLEFVGNMTDEEIHDLCETLRQIRALQRAKERVR